MQVAVKALQVTAVTYDAMAIRGFFIKSVSPAIHPLVEAEHSRMHHPHGFGAEYPRAVELTVLQMGKHELAHVACRSRDAAGGERVHDFKWAGRRRTYSIALRNHRRKRSRDGLRKCCVVHAQWAKDIFIHVVFETFS